MRLKEQHLWDQMRDAIAPSGTILQRIENVLMAGMADVISLKDGFVVWSELKAVHQYPVRRQTPVLGDSEGVTIEQRNFHLTWWQRGGRSLIIVGVGDGRDKAVHAFPGTVADDINRFTRAEFEVLGLAHDWIGIEALLRGENWPDRIQKGQR